MHSSRRLPFKCRAALRRGKLAPLDLRQTFVLANEFKEGDLIVGGGDDSRVRDEARRSLGALRIGDIVPGAFVDDGVTEALERSLDQQALAEVSSLTIAEVKESLLGPSAAAWVERHCGGLPSEAIAAVAKVMTNDELSFVARAIFNGAARLKGSRSSGGGSGSRSSDAVTVGSEQHFGSRIQPNSPGDDEDEILLSILEGLS